MASAKLYPEANPFELRKADDLELSQIQNLFVEPSSEFLASLVGERRHQLLKGGRGAGKTITLRKLGAALSPPSHDHRILGVYLPLDVTQFTPFEESKIGAMGAWLFESYFSGIIIQELISTLLLEQVRSRIELRLITTEQLCERILGILAYDPTVPPRSLEALLQS